MRVTKQMLDAAADVLGYEVDHDRIESAVYNVEGRQKLQTVKDAQARLKGLEVEFEARGGRGVELADEIDDLRVYLAVRDLIPQDRELTVTIKVTAPSDLTPARVAQLVQRCLDCGMNDAEYSEDECEDYEDPDRTDVLDLSFDKVTAQGE